jgi:cellulose synthase (UDP-forming)
VRSVGSHLAIQFHLMASVERDLLVRKLFTAGLDTTRVSASPWTATREMLTAIWSMRTEMLERITTKALEQPAATVIERLPAQSLLIAPRPQTVRLTDFVEQRRAMAA